MPPVIDPGTIADRARNALTAELGTYTFDLAGGAVDTSPAFKVESGEQANAQGVFAQPRTEGLECVVNPEVDEDFQPALGGDYTDEFTTTITLKQWSLTDTTRTGLALLKTALSDLIAPGGIGPRVLRNAAADSIESVEITIVHQLP